jgi:CheY-like chemotaxis protein
LPVLFEGHTKAVIELASLAEFTSTHLTFLSQLTESIGIVLNTIEATMRTEGLLQQSQKLATELQAQQRELQQTNEELGNKAKQLAEQNAEVERKNREIEQARHALEEKAAELALASKYKSEFLANMSHELRTPLNSILILAQQLAGNGDGNLKPKQVEFAKNIHAAGADLMNLISDILDLSKIESGTVTVEPEEVLFARLRDAVERSFRHVAEAKHLAFDIEMEPGLPRSMSTDVKRLQQVLKNLLSNAFKFTSQGQVSFRVRPASGGWSPENGPLNRASRVIVFEVSDTGIGISPEKQKIIFEAFHQADAGTSRRFGGTGLGLAISRELATLLGGEIRLTSIPNEGSTFSLYLPETYLGAVVRRSAAAGDAVSPAPLIVQQAPKVDAIDDDRESIMPGDPVVLIVEDDIHFAHVLLSLAREKGFKGVVTTQGGHVRSLTRQFKPLAIMLDIFLPDMLGWTVLNHLKQDPETRHVPVQIISVEEERLQGLGHGAFNYLIKPATTDELKKAFDRVVEYAQTRERRLLIVEDNDIERQSIAELLGHRAVEIVTAGSGAEAWEALRAQRFDCVVLDLRLPDVSGFELLERIRHDSDLNELPIVVFTGKDLTEQDEIRLIQLAESVVLKGVQSPERLLDETALFLHVVAADLPPAKQEMLERLRQSDEALWGKKLLVVDDDVRNIFALTSLLEQHGLRVVSAENGAEAISLLETDSEIDAVLMDIMMPEMDGYETMRRIRQNAKNRLLPILALTAKAMKGDREKCLEAGASDYIAKPVNTEELLALLRIWLFGKQRSSNIIYEVRTNG